MRLTLQQLRLFEAVLRNGSYTRAAEELHLTQPAVSIQIKRLEEQVGLPLFEKVGKKSFPTPAGETVYAASLEILGKLDNLGVDIERMKGNVEGPLTISVVTTTKYFLPRLLGQFLRHYPAVEPRLRFSNRARVVERLFNNDDDFVVMGQVPDDSQLESYPFLENILVPVAPPEHPLVGQKNIPLETLVNERFLEREEGSGTRIAFDRLLKENDLQLEPYMELGSAEAIKQGVMSQLGLAVLSLHALRLERDSGKLAILDVQGFPIRRRWYAVHLKGKTLSLTAKTFLDFILEEGNQVLGLDGEEDRLLLGESTV